VGGQTSHLSGPIPFFAAAAAANPQKARMAEVMMEGCVLVQVIDLIVTEDWT